MCGYGFKIVNSGREQWKGIEGRGSQISLVGNSPFTNSLVEASFGIFGDNKRNEGLRHLICVSFLTEDNLIDPL